MDKVKKPFYKRWWFWVFAFLFLLVMGNLNTQKPVEEAPAPVVKESTAEVTVEPNLREEFNKSFTSGAFIFTEKVRNDKTGRWRTALYADSSKIVDFAPEYYKAYFSSDDEIHFVINMSTKTTSRLAVSNGTMTIDVLEYVDKEEHDAVLLGSGTLLSQYLVNLSDGTVKEIK